MNFLERNKKVWLGAGTWIKRPDLYFRIEKVPKKGQELIKKGPVTLEVEGKGQYMGFTPGEKIFS